MAMVTTESAATADAAMADATTKQPDAADKEYSSYNGASTAGGGAHRARGGGGVVDSVVARWRREDMLDKSPLALHAAAAAFAFVALVLLASNQHGDWMQFDRYQEYRYLLAIAALAFVYSLAQALRHAHRMHGGADPASTPSWRIFDFVADQLIHVPCMFQLAIAALAFAYSLAQALRYAHWMRGGADPASAPSGRIFDFVADQVVAYLLMSALSAATPITNRMRTAVVNNFTDATAAAISMAFLAFVALALAATLSGYKLSKQTYM